MDRTRFRYLIILTACVIVCCLFLSACSLAEPTTNKEEVPASTVTVDKEYTVTVCNGIRHISTGSYKEGTSFSVTAENIADKMFIGWQYEGVMATDLTTYSFLVTQDAALNAVYCDAYTAYLDAYIGKISTDKVIIGYGRDYSLPVPTVEHATFDGWYNGATAFTDAKGKSLAAYNIDGDVMLTAKYTLTPTYSVTVNDGETGTTGVYYEGDNLTVTAAKISGKTYDGWYTVISGDETLLTEEATYSFTVEEDISIYAKYHVSYRVTVLGGVGGGDYVEGETCTINLLEDRDDFVGWRNWATGIMVSDQKEYTFTVTEKVALEAVFS